MARCASHTCTVIGYSYFGRRHTVEGAEMLERIAPVGVPAVVQAGVNLESELEYS